MGVAEYTVITLEEECDDLVGTTGGSWGLECDGGFIVLASQCVWASSNFSKMLHTSSKTYKFLNSTKTHCKTYAWKVKIPSNKRRYQWATSKFVMLWISSLSLKSLLYNILRLSSFCWDKVVSCNFFSKLLTKNSSSRTQKNSPIRSAKVGALMVGGMFAVATMSC